MPEFGSPFSGLAKDRKLTHAELVRAIRFMIAASQSRFIRQVPSKPTFSGLNQF